MSVGSLRALYLWQLHNSFYQIIVICRNVFSIIAIATVIPNYTLIANASHTKQIKLHHKKSYFNLISFDKIDPQFIYCIIHLHCHPLNSLRSRIFFANGTEINKISVGLVHNLFPIIIISFKITSNKIHSDWYFIARKEWNSYQNKTLGVIYINVIKTNKFVPRKDRLI